LPRSLLLMSLLLLRCCSRWPLPLGRSLRPRSRLTGSTATLCDTSPASAAAVSVPFHCRCCLRSRAVEPHPNFCDECGGDCACCYSHCCTSCCCWSAPPRRPPPRFHPIDFCELFVLTAAAAAAAAAVLPLHHAHVMHLLLLLLVLLFVLQLGLPARRRPRLAVCAAPRLCCSLMRFP
jgi:hypothetical protein